MLVRVYLSLTSGFPSGYIAVDMFYKDIY
jgi:hypothetical protein